MKSSYSGSFVPYKRTTPSALPVASKYLVDVSSRNNLLPPQLLLAHVTRNDSNLRSCDNVFIHLLFDIFHIHTC